MIWVMLAGCAVAAFAVGVALLLRRARPGWGAVRVATVAASPVPLACVVGGVALYARIVATLPPKARGMPLLGPIFLVLAGLIAYPVSLTACVVALRRFAR